MEELSKDPREFADTKVLCPNLIVVNAKERALHPIRRLYRGYRSCNLAESSRRYHVGFVMGKSKFAPCPAHTILPLELCAGVLAVERYELIRDEIDAEVEAVKFFIDSKIVLGYICNSTKRFYMYVSNRVIQIRRSTQPDQWHYVPTDLNPAELATRCVPTTQLRHGNWFSGAAFLYHKTGKTIKTIPSLIHVAASFRRSNNEGGDVLKRR